MTNPYFDISAPNNNKVWDYNFGKIDSQILLKKMRPQDLYKIIRFAFLENNDNDYNYVLIKAFIKDCLKNPRNHKYLTVRTKGSDTPKDMPRRNNVIHDILTANPTVFYEGDIELMKEIMTCAVAAGVNPLERSIRQNKLPLGFFIEKPFIKQFFSDMESNEPIIEAQKDFFQFLINLNPKSLMNFGPSNKCALEEIGDELLYYWSDNLHLVKLVIENLPPEGIDENLAWLEGAYKNNKNKKNKPIQTVEAAINELRIRKEASILNDSLNLGVAKTKERIYKI